MSNEGHGFSRAVNGLPLDGFSRTRYTGVMYGLEAVPFKDSVFPQPASKAGTTKAYHRWRR
jgi:hypothetical protein